MWSSVGSMQEFVLRTGVYLLLRFLAWPIFFMRIDDSHYDRIRFSQCCPLFQKWLCGKAASGLERILCGLPVEDSPGKHE